MKIVQSKAELKRQLKSNPENVYFETVQNDNWPAIVGVTRQVKGGTIQGNAFTLETTRPNGEIVHSWLWYEHYDLKNGNLTSKDGNIIIKVYTL